MTLGLRLLDLKGVPTAPPFLCRCLFLKNKNKWWQKKRSISVDSAIEIGYFAGLAGREVLGKGPHKALDKAVSRAKIGGYANRA